MKPFSIHLTLREHTLKMQTSSLSIVTIAYYYFIMIFELGYCFKSYTSNDNKDFILNTPRCRIPNYTKIHKHTCNDTREEESCGERIVFIDRVTENRFKFRIDRHQLVLFKLRHYPSLKEYDFLCEYRLSSGLTFMQRNSSKPALLLDGDIITVFEDVLVLVGCHLRPNEINSTKEHKRSVYRDAYILFVKMFHYKINQSNRKWNVLMIGLESMSQGLAKHVMPNLREYLKTIGWLDFHGHHKIHSDSLYNLMTILSGTSHNKINTISPLIWSLYQNAGYVTVSGDDTSGIKEAFRAMLAYNQHATDHFFRLMRRRHLHKNFRALCFGKKTVSEHQMKYALEFIKAYKEHSFFGLFHSVQLFEDDLFNLFRELRNERTLNNTFMILFGLHGTNVDLTLYPSAAFYEQRLPVLYMWVPTNFRMMYPDYYGNLIVNQFRLTSHYDLYATLQKILDLSLETPIVNSVSVPGCPSCHSLLERVSQNRNCSDAMVPLVWCACQVRKNETPWP